MSHKVDLTSDKILPFSFKNGNVKMEVDIIVARN